MPGSTGIVTIISYPKYYFNNNLYHIFTIFSVKIWIAIFPLFLFCGVINFVNNNNISTTRKQQKCIKTTRNVWLNIVDNYLDMFALLIGQATVPLRVQPKSVFHNPLVVFIFASFLLRQHFSSDITALILSQKQLKFDQFQQLEEQPRVQIMIEEASNTYYYFQEHFPNLQNRVMQITHDEISSTATLRRLIHQNYVLVTSGVFSDRLRWQLSGIAFHNSEEAFILSLSNYAIRKSLENTSKAKLSKL